MRRGDYDPVKFPHRELTEQIIGCFYDVYNELGFGFLEDVYHKAMLVALQAAGLRAEKEVKLRVYFRGVEIAYFEADVFVENTVILELKAADELAPEHEAQLLNYLRASDIELGLLMNFGPKPAVRRRAFSNERKRSRPPVEID